MADDELEGERNRQRRYTRVKQRALQEDFNGVKEQLNDVKSEKFNRCLEALDEIFHEVNHPREQQFDAIAFKELSLAVKAQSANMADLSHRFDFSQFAAKVQTKFSKDGVFNWTDFGLEVGHIITGVPTFETMLGPMAKEVKARKVPERKQVDREVNKSAEKPEEVEQEAEDNTEETNTRLNTLNEHIHDKEDEIFPLLNLLIDPEDHVQTIENFFDFSFLVKNKLVSQDLGNDGQPIGAAIDPNRLSQLENVGKNQMILAINMKELAELTKLLYPDVVASQSSDDRPTASSSSSSSSSGRRSAFSNPLHRDDELYAATDAREQVRILRDRKTQRTQEASQRRAAGGGGASQRGSAPAVGDRRPSAAPNRSSGSGNGSSSGNTTRASSSSTLPDSSGGRQASTNILKPSNSLGVAASANKSRRSKSPSQENITPDGAKRDPFTASPVGSKRPAGMLDGDLSD